MSKKKGGRLEGTESDGVKRGSKEARPPSYLLQHQLKSTKAPKSNIVEPEFTFRCVLVK